MQKQKKDYKVKIAILAGASHALSYKAKNEKATDQEILKYITEKSNEIVDSISADFED